LVHQLLVDFYASIVPEYNPIMPVFAAIMTRNINNNSNNEPVWWRPMGTSGGAGLCRG
jgi:hypothetical protein